MARITQSTSEMKSILTAAVTQLLTFSVFVFLGFSAKAQSSLGASSFLSAEAGTQSGGSGETARALPPTYLNLRLTYGLSSAILAGYFRQMNQDFNPRQFSHKQYLLTFLTRWSQLIESGRFQSTAQIFAQIKSEGGYLGTYYPLWENMTSGSGPVKINLGDYRNAALAVVFRSEGNPADASLDSVQRRTAEILDRMHFFLLASSKDYEVSQVIGESFRDVSDSLIRERARNLVEGIPAQKFLSVLVTARDLFLPLSIAKPVVQTTRISFAAASRVRAAVHRAALRVNPIFKRMTDLQKGAVGAGLVHFGAYKVISDLRQAGASDEVITLAQNQAFALALGVLWQNIALLNAEMAHLDSNNFTPSFQPASKEEIVTQAKSLIQASLPGGNPAAQNAGDYLTFFLQAEKLEGVDERGSKDQFAMHVVKARLDELEAALATQLRSLPPSQQIDAFRKVMIDGGLHRYKRDYPNLTSVYLGWGGNCVAQSMAMTGMFKRLESQFQFPEGLKFGLAQFPQHIEPVVYNDKKVILLFSGQTVERAGGLIYRPEYLLYRLLRNFHAQGQLSAQNFIDGSVEERAKQWNLKGEALAYLANGVSNLMNLKSFFIRKGVMDNTGSILFSWTGKNRWPGSVPEVAEMEFRPSSLNIGKDTQFSNSLFSFLEESGSIFDLFKPDELSIVLKYDHSDKMPDGDRSYHPFRPFVAREASGGRPREIAVWDQRRFALIKDAKERYGERSPKFKQFLIQYLFSEIENSPEFQRAFAAAGALNQAEDLLKLNDEDAKLLPEANSEFYQYQTLEAPMDIGMATTCLGPKPDRCGLADANEGANVLSRVHRDQFYMNSPGNRLNQRFSRFMDHINQVAEQEPERFLRVYNQATLAQRQFLLSRALRLDAQRKSIKNYINSLSPTEIEIAAQNDCSQNSVDLPTVSQGAPWFYVVKEKCERPPTHSTAKVPQRAGRKLQIAFKPEILIELTVDLQAGLHLWTPKLVDLFIAGRYGPTRFGNEQDISSMQSLFGEVRAVSKLPAHLQKLWKHLFPEPEASAPKQESSRLFDLDDYILGRGR